MDMDLERIAERKIEEAIAEGKFSALPGKGRPLHLEKDAGIPAHLRILRNAGVPPEWVLLEDEIAAARLECAQVWARMERQYPSQKARVREHPRDASPMDRERFNHWVCQMRAEYLDAVSRVNTAILKLNYYGPRIQRIHHPLNTRAEAERFDRSFPLAEGSLPGSQPSAGTRQGILRAAAHSLYHYGDGKVSLP